MFELTFLPITVNLAMQISRFYQPIRVQGVYLCKL